MFVQLRGDGLNWQHYIIDPNAPTDRHSLKQTADMVFAAIHKDGPDGISFSNLQQPVNGEHLALALRCSATWRRAIPSWLPAVQLAYDALLEKGKDPQGALFGMI